ncbi:hypothetical protein [Erwinia amylovora]
MCIRDSSDAFSIAGGGDTLAAISVPLRTVSYTHLDVYKRQEQAFKELNAIDVL